MANQSDKTRRRLLRDGLWGTCMAGLGVTAGLSARGTGTKNTVWQIDPYLCTQCGKCATYCVLELSAVKCVQAYAMCGYCDLCTGYLEPDRTPRTGAENELCPTGAIKRTFVEKPYYEYTIDEALCNGCAKCVEGCQAFGNGSFYLQVRHDRCVNCNECAIAAVCPSGAFKRVPVDEPYLLKEVISE
jgi:Na+-translocating ferredoxin:NAD+ oxidoreductase subunit B